MSIKPILFSSPMVRALLEGRKSQTRRVVKPQRGLDFIGAGGDDHFDPAQWGWVNDTGGVCTLAPNPLADAHARCPYGQPGDLLMVRESSYWNGGAWCYRASTSTEMDKGIRWKSSIHMPKDACRLVLRVTGVRVERVESISEADAVAESFADRDAFLHTFYDLNERAQRGTNPWVWAVSFKVEATTREAAQALIGGGK